MASWQEFESQAPELAKAARRLMDTYTHKVLATLRKDGSPRVSGIETKLHDGELWTGSMPGSVKAADLRRDPRMAIHVTSRDPDRTDPSSWEGDLKLSGRAVETTDEQERAAYGISGSDSHLFRVELTEVAWTRVQGDELVITAWREGVGEREFRRK
ncbi:hypthetical protein SCD63.18c [[Actinomadura] parvosata subsp. kistnae]|uniref:Pyridoxamine 5-phosphate oxidase n=1 Tax=[Actinomadura] parvosata subsp. kistnae TaxID=1909395 RepID=A0A1V0AJR1_9ACTN|nr:pyridoxamine 5'-phosphate oxidase family protein [Nonomuraea sp. ATCC 55076]AQZ70433.1 pyridoxamine 5-phosphate oxidase [Nonomuraea sp. ATCC 55076]SPL98330.1 hypthetical protein SCD63.18c [Actinomadura parvosata subsp. kistnae]